MNDAGICGDVRIICWDLGFFCQCIAKEGYNVISANHGSSFILKIVRELWFKYIKMGSVCWYNQGNKNFSGVYIVMDAMIQLNYMKWLARNNPKSRIIFWYWNQINENSKIRPEELKMLGCEVWSFNKIDCAKYGLKYNPTFFCENFYKDIDAVEHPVYKLSFVGKNKGRIYHVMRAVEQLGEEKCYVHITANHFYERWKNKLYKRNISYTDTLRIQNNSEAILEIVPAGSEGLTLRTMDAMVMKKKFITNNISVKDLDFYNPNNIYILSEENESGIEEFLKLPYMDIVENKVRYYRVDHWIGRFLNGEDANKIKK